MGLGMCKAVGATACSAEARGGITLGPVAMLPTSCTSSSKGSQLVCEASAPPAASLLAAGVGREVDLVDAGGGGRVRTLKGHSGPVTCLLVAGGMLFSGSIDRTVKRWDTQKLAADVSMEGHTGAVWCLSFIVDVLYSSGDDQTVRRWDAKLGTALSIWKEHSGPITCMLSYGRYLFSGSQDTTVVRWDLLNLQQDTTLIGHRAGVSCLLVAEGAVWCGARDGVIRRWRLQAAAEEEPDAILRGDKPLPDVAACLIGADRYVFSGHLSGTIRQWDIERNTLVRTFADRDKHEAGVLSFLVQQDLLLSGGADGTVRLWDKASGDLCNILEGGSGVTCLVETSGGTIFGGQARGGPQRLPPLTKSQRERHRSGTPMKNSSLSVPVMSDGDSATEDEQSVKWMPVECTYLLTTLEQDDILPLVIPSATDLEEADEDKVPASLGVVDSVHFF
mmetsp:Transcript_108211/g.312743  ORF Transcript_108211/g.312743 Transcript_108211/m.312743 type:complete len:448 (-) Transcript_108211:101-1444(-)|eukprot:CAMPEP_0176018468 /NCGR_PEP_ID=MMETSP0120_2-20121206/8892_1 /TAXON_ID=160619 /ORGANISM="Kryptoperidinium foliaceum, Strain CCMP 1326" /LENGTH=447 /DNA_ID=CAMNT_0017351517 /DNA_START=77 /DNA_END=1420 /DNA_ORIENTATION=+